MTTQGISNREKIARHHEATAASHRAYALTVGLESIADELNAAADYFTELATTHRSKDA